MKEFLQNMEKALSHFLQLVRWNTAGSSCPQLSWMAANVATVAILWHKNVMQLWCQQAIKEVNCYIFIHISTGTIIVKIAQEMPELAAHFLCLTV